MCKPFIGNHQFNLIQKQANLLLQALQATDPQVAVSVRDSVKYQIWSEFPEATEAQSRLLDHLTDARTEDEVRERLRALEPYVTEFPPLSDKKLKALFPKVKKLTVPDLSAVDFRRLTYWSWTDIATNRMFLVWVRNGQPVGIEGRFTPVNKKGACFLCNRQSELVLFSAVSKAKPAHTPADYYKAVGQYLCRDAGVCNRHITSEDALERFVREVTGAHDSSHES
jgi:hypothetical protein